jgi:hypothetical protein
MAHGQQRQLITRQHWCKWTSPYTAGLDTARQRFVTEAVHGMVATGSTVLSEMARGIYSHGIHIDYVAKRFSRNLASAEWHPQTLHDQLLERHARFVSDDTPIYIDLSEIAKPHAKKMPKLCKVRDASDTEKRLVKGYWLFEAYAEPSHGQLVPLAFAIFSPRQRKFISQNKVVLDHLEALNKALEGRGIFIMDRGFDGRRYLDALLEMEQRFILRLRDSRDLVCDDGAARRVGHLALRLVRPEDGRDIARSTLVRLPKDEHELLFVASPSCVNDPRPVKLLAWLGQDGIDCARWRRRCQQLYRRRWKAEDAIRFLKMELGLEQVRVLSWRALQHMMALVALAMTIIALAASEPEEWLTEVIRRGRARRAPAEFLYYRIRRGVAHLLRMDPLL